MESLCNIFISISTCTVMLRLPLLMKGCESEVVCPVWSSVNSVDTIWNETIGAQRLDTDVCWYTQVQVLQNTLHKREKMCSAWTVTIKILHVLQLCTAVGNTSVGRDNTLVHAELMTDLWKSPLTKTCKWQKTMKTRNFYVKHTSAMSLMLYLVLPTLYPYTNVPLLQPSSSSGGLSQPIIRLFWPTVLRTSTERTSAGLSGDDRQSKQFVALCVQDVNVCWQ